MKGIKLFKRIVTFVLTMVMLTSFLPGTVLADESEGEYKITNEYLWFSYNAKTGGFAIETEEGNPQKIADDDMPLLYADDDEGSSGTSFITVRIDGKDYIFGQNYRFEKVTVNKPVIKEQGRLMEIPWTVNDVTVTLKAALDNNSESDTMGNVGFSFEVENNSGSQKEISIRLLLDTALGNRIDAPYFVVDEKKTATLTETEFSDLPTKAEGTESVPGQIRSVDSLTNPQKLSYIIMKGWNYGKVPNRVILGHWANLANTRYDYTPSEYCDFTNYSNDYRSPDSAAAIYWEGNTLSDGESIACELLYGVGNFSNSTGYPMGINMTTGRVELSEDGKSYKNDGKISLSVEIDNTVDDWAELSVAQVTVSTDDKLEIVPEESKNDSFETYYDFGNTIEKLSYTLKAAEQNDLCAGTIYVSVIGTKILSDGTQEDFETAAERSIVLPSVSGVSKIQLNKINPEIVYTQGEKTITVSGKMQPLSAMVTNDAEVDLKLKHKTSNHEVTVNKEDIVFLDDTYETMTLTTKEELEVGEYSIVFEINDKVIKDNIGCDKIVCEKTLQVSADPKYQLRSYGMIALVRITEESGTDYDFFTFENENAFKKFYKGKESATGVLNKKTVKCDFGEKDAIEEHEIILTVRGNIKQMTDPEDGNSIFWQADYANGDIIINNMLSYEGDTVLKIYKNKSDEYCIEGDGLIKVINSINVWRSKWSISVKKGDVYTLDTERLSEAGIKSTEEVTLALGGAASMLQTIGGFAVSLKYGVLSSQWNDDDDGWVTYGIGFGGKITLPIKASKKSSDDDSESGDESGGSTSGGSTSYTPNVVVGNAMPDDSDFSTSDEALHDYLANKFGEEMANSYMSGELSREVSQSNSESGSGSTSTTQSESTIKSASTGDKQTADGSVESGKLSAEVNNVLFGEKAKVTDGVLEVTDTGFIGIDATFSLKLPEDVLGSFVSNMSGIEASVTINTIENQYEVDLGLGIMILECEGVLAFKQVSVMNKDKIVPDKIEFYIKDGLKVPIVPPVLYMTGLGGGVNGLADTIGENFDKLPPLTILLYTKLEAIGVLEGEFNAKANLEGITLSGEMELSRVKDALSINAEVSARWIEPWELSLCGSVSVVGGIIEGGLTVIIADDYFYGYVYATIYVPSKIPLVGGKKLASIEAAVSHEFIGTNVKILGIKFGVIYYWGDDVSFGSNIDLSAPERKTKLSSAATDNSFKGAVGYYGTNIYALPSSFAKLGESGESGDDFKTAAITVDNVAEQNALLLEIPFTGREPETADIRLFTPKPNSTEIKLVADDGEGGGNMLVQNRDDGKFIYITVTDLNVIKNGSWTIEYNGDKLEISTVRINGVADIAELDKNGTSAVHDTEDSMTVTASWTVKGASEGDVGTIDVYLTKDKDILTKIETDYNTGDALGVNISHEENVDLLNVNSVVCDLPDALDSGSYYTVTTLSTQNGISLAISSEPFAFKNKNLPKDVGDDAVKVSYGGNGGLCVKVTDAEDADYTHYIAEIVAEDGTVLENNVGQFEKGESFIIGREALLEAGKSYYVKVKTLKEKYKNTDGEYKNHYYYGSGEVESNVFTLPEAVMPKLKNVTVNIDTSAEDINTNVKNVIIDYEFENDVFMYLSVNGSKLYSFGETPNYKDKSTYFKKNWRFVLDDLEDGDYVVDFTAYADNDDTDSKDHMSGSQMTDIENAYFGFTVDTSNPVLSLAQKSITTKVKKVDEETKKETEKDVTTVFAKNTVVADDDGVYTIEGITEKAVTLMLDGEIINNDTAGVTINANGNFTIEKKLNDGVLYTSHSIKAIDKAGNTSEIIVWVVSGSKLSFKSLEIRLDGEKIDTDSYGEKKISLTNSDTARLSVYGIIDDDTIDDDTEVELDSSLIEWNVMYAKNTVDLSDGTVTALAAGETAVKAKLITGIVTSEGVTRNDGISDYVVIDVKNNSKSDLVDKIYEAESLLAANSNKSDAKKKALQTAIDNAKEIVNNKKATDSDYTNGVSELSKAMSEFLKTGSESGNGSTSSGGSGGGSAMRYTATVEQSEHGRVELSHSSIYYGSSLTITAIPDDGYVVSDMLINGESVGRLSVYTISSVTQNISVKVIFSEKSDELPFIDVSESDWFYPYVKSAYENGYMLGVTDTEFKPNTYLTRAMFVTILHRIDGTPIQGKNVFSDVSEGEYYEAAVAWANENGIVLGVTETKFAPNEKITREQMATILYRYVAYKGLDVSVGEDTNILSYTDFDEISEYAVSAMQYAAGSGIITGKTESTLNPKDNATRAEAATVFVRFAQMLKK